MEAPRARRAVLSRQIRQERGSPAVGVSDRPRGVAGTGPSPADLAAYRSAVDDVVQRLEHDGAVPAPDRVAEHPEVRAVLDLVPGGTDDVLARIAQEVGAFRPSPRSNARTPATLLKILLLQQIDVLWWSSVRPFTDDADVLGSPEMAWLPSLRRRRQLAFRYRVCATHFPARARNHAVHRWAPGREPVSSGLSYPVARPAMVALLNEVADRFAQAAGPWPGSLWVNCIVRSTAVQQRLRALGYSALLPSAHCTGHAADIEMAWLRRHGVAAALEDVLTAYRTEGVLNVIDEGQAWHVCLNPAVVDRYERLAPLTAGPAGSR
ncbi:hypothetical protein SAMN04488107_4442 [Geodermatophilus saharensis]|uniref:Uncharacterized protein n=1 Tax=Geodermatophilus saharensis TaxID=1137994 RepID=A0A239IQX5_9ACTN|nr:DUF5715 family protein [Geodermatophilus saharensis]SNS96040.1 hypothetical protein SAMN04488107_4442 [Geodermatophilus saharensis]